jgi:D-amino-acid dehydrogenase
MSRVAVVGGGVVGLLSAWHLARRGHEVSIVERSGPGRDGCSYGNAGMIVPSHFVPLAAPGMIRLGLRWLGNPESPFAITPAMSWDLLAWLWRFRGHCNRRHVDRASPVLRDLNLASRGLYERLDAELPGGIGLERRGLVMLCRTEAGLAEEAHGAAVAARLGVPAEVLSAEGVARTEPALAAAVVGGVLYPLDCHLSPAALMANLQADLERAGASFHWGTDVTGFAKEGPRIRGVRTDRGEIAADEVVLCAGVWSPSLARDLGLRIPVQPGKGYSLTLERPARLPRLCAILVEDRVAITPIGAALRFGGTMEIGGRPDATGPDGRPRIAPRRIAGIVKSVVRALPAFKPEDFAGITPWVGLRPCTPDGLPCLGRPRRYDNLVVNTGHAMMGISLAAVSGRMAAELLDREPPASAADRHALELLSPDRFG